jgi:outer membrane protein TolC
MFFQFRKKYLAFLLVFLPGIAGIHGADMRLNFAAAADMAVAASAELKNAYANQAIKEQAWTLGLRAYFPRVGLSVSENDRLQIIGPDTFVKNYTINLDQLVWDGGRTSMSRTLQRMEHKLTYSQLERMAVDIAEAALSAYRSVLSSRAVMSIRKASLETLAQQRRILAGEVELGLALPVDLAEADLTLAAAEIEILSLSLDLAELEQQFAEILGLDKLPELTEKVDVSRAAILPSVDLVRSVAGERNPDIAEARFSVFKRQGELKYSSRSWIPSFRLQGSFGLSGNAYPLTRYTWAVGLNIELSGPWLQNSFGFQTGGESSSDRTAQLQNNLSPLPDPASALTRRQAEQALLLEQEKYRIALERIGRFAQRGLEKCFMADRVRSLAVRAIDLAAERYRLEEIRLNLGQITRLNLMESLLEYTQKEIEAVNAAAALLEAEWELERLLDLKPGDLEAFAAAARNPEKSTWSFYE